MTVKKYMGLKGQSLSVAIAIIAGLDFLLFGYDQGVMGGLLTVSYFTDRFPEINVNNPPAGWTSSHTADIQGITVGAYNLGCFVGAIATIWLGNKLGRRRMILTGSIIMCVGAIIMTAAYGLPQFIVGRIITGIGNGMNTSTVPTWQSETSKSHKRGKMVMIEGSLIAGGIALSYWIDLGLSFVESEASWRFPIAFQLVFAIIIAATIMFLPESPRWLMLQGRDDEAKQILSSLNDLEIEDPRIEADFLNIKEAVTVMATGTFKDLFKMGKHRNLHRVLIAYTNQMFQQIAGINLVVYYAATIFQRIGLSDFLSRLLAACHGTFFFAVSWVAFFTIERVGRRKLMIFGATGMAITFACLAGFDSKPDNEGLGIAQVVFLFVYYAFFGIGWLGMTWLYPAEIVPLSIRAPANALSTSANWLFNFTVVMIAPPAFENIQYNTYTVFAIINGLLILPVTYFFYPETAGRSLEEMDDIFERSNAFNVVRVAYQTPMRFNKEGELIENPDVDIDEATLNGDPERAGGKKVAGEKTSSGDGTGNASGRSSVTEA